MEETLIDMADAKYALEKIDALKKELISHSFKLKYEQLSKNIDYHCFTRGIKEGVSYEKLKKFAEESCMYMAYIQTVLDLYSLGPNVIDKEKMLGLIEGAKIKDLDDYHRAKWRLDQELFACHYAESCLKYDYRMEVVKNMRDELSNNNDWKAIKILREWVSSDERSYA